MANENQTAQTKPVTPAANGSTPTATTAPAKRVNKPREVPAIVVAATKDEYAEIQANLVALLGGLNLKTSLGPYVLACALRDMRRTAAANAAKAAQPATK